MPIVGRSGFEGNPESILSLEASCASVNCSAMLGKTVRIRDCPATVSDICLQNRHATARKREGPAPVSRKVRRPVAL
jgi:hypothetical protein